MAQILCTRKYHSGFVVVLFLTLTTFANASHAWNSNLHENFTDVSPKELFVLISDGNTVVYDVNTNWYRAAKGIVPGTKFLKTYNYDPVKKLPADKSAKLVFYCANKMCTSAPLAAQVAEEAGYRDVNVMVDGIDGWIEQGFATEIY